MCACCIMCHYTNNLKCADLMYLYRIHFGMADIKFNVSGWALPYILIVELQSYFQILENNLFNFVDVNIYMCQ